MRKYISKAGIYACIIFLFASKNAITQELKSDSSHSFTYTAFIDTYYSYDFSNPANHEKADFLYNHKRHNEVNINLALIKLSYNNKNTRAHLGLMAGTYPQYNLAHEPELLKHLYEASVGVKISGSKNLWIDAGIMPSHIGFENAISSNNWTLGRSIQAENSPYYEAGIRLSYTTSNEKWFLSGLLLNGWQRISREEANNSPAFGTQLTFTPGGKINFNWSSFIGSMGPDSIHTWRYFSNIYSVWKPSEKLGITVGLDYCLQQKERKSKSFNSVFSPVVIVRYQLKDWAFAARAEYYRDEKGMMVPLVDSNPFSMQGYSINIDRAFGKKILWRTEGRVFKNDTPYFEGEKSNQIITSSLAVLF